MSRWLERIRKSFDGWLFAANNPKAVPPLRILFAAMLLIYVGGLWVHSERWFADTGLLTSQTAQKLGNHANWSVLYLLPSTALVIQCCLATMFLQCMLVLVGVWSRFNMACIFVWLVSFQNRNPLILDGEDTLFRIFAFLMIWLPLDCGWSVTRWWSKRVDNDVRDAVSPDAWALTLMQVEMTLIYLSATYNKLGGATWRDGTAMYYVSFMTDHFGRIPGSRYWFDRVWFVHLSTYSALVIEAILPIALWIPRLRLWAVALGVMLHLGIEATMHLFLFEWVMIFGLLTFLGRKHTARASYPAS